MSDRTVTHQTVAHIPVRALRLEVLSGPDAGLAFTSGSDRITLGTAPGNDVVLSDETVSRYHAELSPGDGGIAVRDLTSRNGTAVGATAIRDGTVPGKTILRLGRTQIRVDDAGTVDMELYDGDSLGGLRGRTAKMRRLMATIRRAAPSDVSVLLHGETGCGKEVVARAIHDASPRAGGPFETVDCGSLMPTLVASELFGHEQGAFTGAHRRHTGAFERAHGGTLFLDEIGELPAALQPVLLGVLERRTLKRLGGSDPVGVDVRLVSATHRDLREEVNRGDFRQDLYYRIAVLTMSIPPLRERTEDIPLLIEHFLREAGESGPMEAIISDTAMRSLERYRWPGNVRELRNFVEATLAMGEVQRLDPAQSAMEETEKGEGLVEAVIRLPYKEARSRLLEAFESRYLEALLERNRGNVASAARDAKMARSYLNEMLRRRGLR